MTHRIFDIENEKDYADLWDILQDRIIKLVKPYMCESPYTKYVLAKTSNGEYELPITINWHDKTEITRPIQEATESDIGKLCYFWDYDEEQENGTGSFGKLCIIDEHKVEGTKYQGQNIGWFPHWRRLTKQEIEELC